jgi:hypothetical protein
MVESNKTKPMKPGAKVDPKGAALVKKMRALRNAELGTEHVGHIRIMPKIMPPSDHCNCSCSCT